jgi:hypothetical protein
MKASKISKVAGFSFLGFCVAAATADKVNLNPLASQVAGFVGAFVGSLVATRRRSKLSQSGEKSKSG